jgi:hypothetical protein
MTCTSAAAGHGDAMEAVPALHSLVQALATALRSITSLQGRVDGEADRARTCVSAWRLAAGAGLLEQHLDLGPALEALQVCPSPRPRLVHSLAPFLFPFVHSRHSFSPSSTRALPFPLRALAPFLIPFCPTTRSDHPQLRCRCCRPNPVFFLFLRAHDPSFPVLQRATQALDVSLSQNLLHVLREFTRGTDALHASLRAVVGDVVTELRLATEQRNPGMGDRVLADGARALTGIVHQLNVAVRAVLGVAVRDGPTVRALRREAESQRARAQTLVVTARQRVERAVKDARVNHDGALLLARGLNDVLSDLKSGKWGRQGGGTL